VAGLKPLRGGGAQEGVALAALPGRLAQWFADR
jgi:hypothetical protein